MSHTFAQCHAEPRRSSDGCCAVLFPPRTARRNPMRTTTIRWRLSKALPPRQARREHIGSSLRWWAPIAGIYAYTPCWIKMGLLLVAVWIACSRMCFRPCYFTSRHNRTHVTTIKAGPPSLTTCASYRTEPRSQAAHGTQAYEIDKYAHCSLLVIGYC